MQKQPWLQAHSGKAIDLLNPDPSSILIEDIAHSLARIGRYTGHTTGNSIYSVAQHSCIVAGLLPDELKFEGLMHDAHEAYIGDISTPVKDAIRALGSGSGLDTLDQLWMSAIAKRFGFSEHHHPSVKHADRQALVHEVASFLAPSERPWVFDGLIQGGTYYSAWSIDTAQQYFLRMFKELAPPGV